MPRSTPEHVASRRNEIVDACDRLYSTKGFADITMADIARETTFTRTSIYNYFHTKEEIFLALLQREYDGWADEVDSAVGSTETMSDDELAEFIACSLQKRVQMLRILSMNFYDMEGNSRIGNLVDFKRSYGRTITSVRDLVSKNHREFDERDLDEFTYSFFPFLYGLCPYCEVTDLQMDAMRKAGMEFVPHSVHDLTYNLVTKLLKGKE
ncbi:MAG: TetR/AcrR family transcriptional regulator [Candidatus Methanomethylophilaceae archaeon]|nr:TetR/AcrR family transcriptional regulator [Candidatus Methanomethylophilaceae archaeon]